MAVRRSTTFQPRFTLALLYVAALFFAFALLFALPSLVDAFRQLSPEAQGDTELAAEIARQAAAPRLPIAFGLAVIATAVGAWSGWLPGLGGGRR